MTNVKEQNSFDSYHLVASTPINFVLTTLHHLQSGAAQELFDGQLIFVTMT